MEIEIRSSSEAVVRGYVNVVERYSRRIRNGNKVFYEKIKSGAFKKAIESAAVENRAIDMLIDHKKDMVVAKTGSDLNLKEDNVGLFAEATIRDEKVIERARNGDARGWSFGFVSQKDSYTHEGENEIRTVEELELREVSLIFDKNPCYTATSVEVRSVEGGDVEFEVEERGCEDTAEIVVKLENSKKCSCEGYKRKVEILKNL